MALAVLLAACEVGRERAAPRELRINLETEPPTLDWSLATDGVSFEVILQLVRGLTQLDSALRVEPDLAERWEVSADGRTYTFYLRDGVRWSDGRPLVAQHFVDSWLRLLAPETAAEYAYFLYPVVGAREFNVGTLKDPARVGVRALGPRIFEVELAAPLVYFPALASFAVTFPQRADLIARHGRAWTEPGKLVSLGPYVLDAWRHDYKLELRANPGWFRGAPPIERIAFFMIEEDSTALVLFEQHVLDLVKLPPLEIRAWQARPEFLRLPILRGYYFGFDTREKPFDDARVRRAFALAIDRDAFPALLRGGEQPWASWIPPAMPHANGAIGLRYDPAAARRLLAEAGLDAKSLGPIRIVYNSDETHRLVAEKIQAFWRENLGAEVRLENREWKVFLRELTTDPPMVFRGGWGADFPDPDNFMNLFTSYSANNWTRWANPRFDELVERAAREPEPSARQALYDEAQRLLVEEDAAIVPLFAVTMNFAVAPRLRGFAPSPMDQYFFDRVRLE